MGKTKGNSVQPKTIASIFFFLRLSAIFNNLAFVGGTALRVLYDLRRYSEDLDFSLVKKQGYSFTGFLHKLNFYPKCLNLLEFYKPAHSFLQSRKLYSI